MRSQQSLNMIAFGLAIIALTVATEDSELKRPRDGKLLGLFQVVTFPNNICAGTGKNGTCYTADECSSKGGTNAGSCASGYGVCCTFAINCGATSSENCTYIESNAPSAGFCKHTICPCSDNICQLRLDFDTFVIAGPSTNTASETLILNGSPNAGGQANSLASQCLTDTFSVTNSAGTNPAPICGINSGQHMYVDVDRSRSGEGCNELNFQLGSAAIGTNLANRQWSIKVSQIECDSTTRAPDGCTQYFLDSADTVQTYNFDGGQHLAWQKQSICVRRNRGQCRICWSAVTPEDFALSGTHKTVSAGKGKGFTTGKFCCGYMADGLNNIGYDCLQIPGAMIFGADTFNILNSRFCGRSVGLAWTKKVTVGGSTTSMEAKTTTQSNADISVCSTQTPFVIRFVSDGFEEQATEILKPNKGFRLAYTQDSTNCP